MAQEDLTMKLHSVSSMIDLLYVEHSLNSR